MDDRFGHPPEDEAPKDPTEGVRIIGAEEAAEALERGDVASRLSERDPRPGDRPSRPEGERPSLRFPLAADTDPTGIIRPPVVPPTLPGDRGPQGPVSESVELPHWTDPPTGEVPAVLIREDEGDDLDAWSSFAASPPRWHSGDDDWDEDFDTASLGDDETRVGALDDRDRPLPGDLFDFADLDELVDDEPAPLVPPLMGRKRISIEPDDSIDPTYDEVAAGARGGIDVYEAPVPELEDDLHRPPRRRRSAPGSVRTEERGLSSPAAAGRDIPTAVVAGGGIGLVALVLFALGSAFATALVVVILGLCAGEFYGAVQRGGARPAALLGLVASVAFPLAVYWRGEPAFALMGALTVVFTLLWFLSGAGSDAPVLEGVGITLFGIAWIGVLGSFATLMLRAPDGRGMVLAAVLVTVAYDVAAFFVGRAWGTRAISETSPNKTVGGLIGGAGGAIVMGLFVSLLKLGAFHHLQYGLLLGIVVAVVAPLGDLCESLVKRDLGLKDMGSVIPGHGGLLDRFDSLLFVLPATYYLIVAFHLVP